VALIIPATQLQLLVQLLPLVVKVQDWNSRKAKLMQTRHIQKTFEHLQDQQWVSAWLLAKPGKLARSNLVEYRKTVHDINVHSESAWLGKVIRPRDEVVFLYKSTSGVRHPGCSSSDS